MADEIRLDDIVGITRDVPLTYMPRGGVDEVSVNNLTRDKHIVVHGSSKQGKTCLRKWNLDETSYVTVACSHTWDLAQLHAALLKQAGYRIEQTSTRTIGGGRRSMRSSMRS